MSLLEDIQKAAVDPKTDLGTLLRSCKLLAARLGSKPLEDWLIWESNGYPENAAVPEYRIWGLQLKGHFAGPFGAAINNAPIPMLSLPEEARNAYQNYNCRQSAASIDEMIRQADTGVFRVQTGDLSVFLGTKVYQGYNCIECWADLPITHLIELLNSVRNRILDFTLAIWKEEPAAGQSTTLDKVQPTKVTQIFHTTVYGGSANLVGSANQSSLSFNILENNFDSLSHVLTEQGINAADLKELYVALDNEKNPAEKGKFGQKVSNWISKMIQKAADGSWEIGVGAAGNLIAQALGRYYGWQ